MKQRKLLALLLMVSSAASAQTASTVPFSSPRWAMSGTVSEVVQHKGQEAIRLRGGDALLNDARFSTGTIEFDIAFSDTRGFQGVRWSVQDEQNWEEFYLRSHLSGMPDANQYTPVIAGRSGWQLYHGQGYSAPTLYADDWIHVRIVLGEELGDVYVDADTVAFTFRKKGDMGPGGLAVYASGLNTSYFANFSYSTSGTVVGRAPRYDAAEAGTVLKWSVSDPFASEGSVAESGRNWQDVWAEERGITNLSRAAVGTSGSKILARVFMEVDEPTAMSVKFGYSDRVRVFLNGTLLYAGDNTYVSRDYRYLGTIGLFDEVPLSLAAGKNELLFEVTEAFGGWGVIAQFPETSGITFGEGVLKH